MLLLENKEIVVGTSGLWSVETNTYNGTKCLSKDGNFLIHDHSDYVYKNMNPIIYNRPTHLLILGLGLSLIPNYFSSFCNDIDVVENDIDLINLITGNSFNDPSINIINDDAYTYSTTKLYDLVVSDIHWVVDESYETQKNQLISKYNQNLDFNGKIYFYLDGQLINKN